MTIVDLLRELRPSSPLLLFIAVAIPTVWLLRQPRSSAARRALVTVIVGYWLLATRTGSGPLVYGLSHGLGRITAAAEARGADVVVVLSGGAASFIVDSTVAATPAPSSVLRTLEGVRVFRLIGARELIVSGGAVHGYDLKPDSELLRKVAIDAGVPQDRVVEEAAARNTREEAAAVKAMVPGGKPIVLVTSPTHMRRALRSFAAVGVDAVPSIAPIRSEHVHAPSLFIPSAQALDESDAAIYDYAATVYYQLTGWTRPPRR